jgi:hypothetical protein
MPAKICAILQPHYLPWIGYFEMIDRVDEFVYLDDVQFIKREWKSRNRIRKTATSEESKWLSVPIIRSDHFTLLNQAHLFAENDWATDHLNALHSTYRRSPFFDDVFPSVRQVLENASATILSDLNIMLVNWLIELLGIDTKCIKSSDLSLSGKREEKLLNICQAINADTYLANNATSNYVGADYFIQNGVDFQTQDYTHPDYPQSSAGESLTQISHLSVLDLLFNIGTGDKALAVIRQGRPKTPELNNIVGKVK